MHRRYTRRNIKFTVCRFGEWRRAEGVTPYEISPDVGAGDGLARPANLNLRRLLYKCRGGRPCPPAGYNITLSARKYYDTLVVHVTSVYIHGRIAILPYNSIELLTHFSA